jgi:hypothetical protein
MDWYTLDGLDKMGNFVGVGGNKDPWVVGLGKGLVMWDV